MNIWIFEFEELFLPLLCFLSTLFMYCMYVNVLIFSTGTWSYHLRYRCNLMGIQIQRVVSPNYISIRSESEIGDNLGRWQWSNLTVINILCGGSDFEPNVWGSLESSINYLRNKTGMSKSNYSVLPNFPLNTAHDYRVLLRKKLC